MRTVAVVGASLAGLRSVQELRNQGFDGHVVVIGEEVHAPYDRPPLSKAFLAGTLPAEDLALAEQSDVDDWAAEWRLGVRADRLDPGTGEIHLSTGSVLRADGLVIATGGRPRTLPGTALLPACTPCARSMMPLRCERICVPAPRSWSSAPAGSGPRSRPPAVRSAWR